VSPVQCEEFRVVVGAEPMVMRNEIAAHAGTCVECAVYRLRLQELVRAILSALHTRADSSARSARPWQLVRLPAWNLAASILLSVAIGIGIWLSGTRSSFADELVAHARHEPASLVHTLDVVSEGELAELLKRDGLRLRPAALRVSYARGCLFHGYSAPHLVVQADHGPVAVLILSHEGARAMMERVHAAGFDAVIVPAPRGMVVALGHGAEVEIVAQTVLRALDYAI
jgi:hypothetical protein